MTPPQRKVEDRPIAALLAPDLIVLLDDAPESVAVETEEMHPADLADVAEAMPPERVVELLAALPSQRAADVLEYLDEELRTELLETMTARQAAQIVVEMTPDDRADALDELEEEVADEILSEIPAVEREETERLLAYPPDSAGGLMTTEFVSVGEELTVADALARVRAMAREGRREAMHTIYATDAEGRIAGVLSLRELLAAPDDARVRDLAWTEVVSVPATADREEVARITSDYDLAAVPVVDGDGRVLGVVTVDDVIDAIQEEQTEDVQKLGGMEALDEPYMTISLWEVIRKRVGWLCILFLGSLLTATVIEGFEGQLLEIAGAGLLTLFIPMIVSSGGNSGSQATSLIIRAMALNEITLRDWWRVAGREITSGLVLGTVLGTLGFARVLAWQHLGWYDYGPSYRLVALVVGLTLLGVVTFGSLAGSMLPFVLRRAGFDPASASAPFVATLVDVTGLLIYFTIAVLILSGTLR
jgi:magnesium transporter